MRSQWLIPPLPFDVWREHLLEDCKRHDKPLPYSRLAEECLRILWESGTEPSVQEIIDSSK